MIEREEHVSRPDRDRQSGDQRSGESPDALGDHRGGDHDGRRHDQFCRQGKPSDEIGRHASPLVTAGRKSAAVAGASKRKKRRAVLIFRMAPNAGCAGKFRVCRLIWIKAPKNRRFIMCESAGEAFMLAPNPVKTYPAFNSFLTAFRDWVRHRKLIRQCRQRLDACDSQEIARIARDVGLSPSDLRHMAELGPDAAKSAARTNGAAAPRPRRSGQERTEHDARFAAAVFELREQEAMPARPLARFRRSGVAALLPQCRHARRPAKRCRERSLKCEGGREAGTTTNNDAYDRPIQDVTCQDRRRHCRRVGTVRSRGPRSKRAIPASARRAARRKTAAGRSR